MYVMILKRHLSVPEGIRGFRAERVCFMEKLSVKRRDYHPRFLFLGVPTL